MASPVRFPFWTGGSVAGTPKGKNGTPSFLPAAGLLDRPSTSGYPVPSRFRETAIISSEQPRRALCSGLLSCSVVSWRRRRSRGGREGGLGGRKGGQQREISSRDMWAGGAREIGKPYCDGCVPACLQYRVRNGSSVELGRGVAKTGLMRHLGNVCNLGGFSYRTGQWCIPCVTRRRGRASHQPRPWPGCREGAATLD